MSTAIRHKRTAGDAYHVGIDRNGNIYELRSTKIAGDTATDYALAPVTELAHRAARIGAELRGPSPRQVGPAGGLRVLVDDAMLAPTPDLTAFVVSVRSRTVLSTYLI